MADERIPINYLFDPVKNEIHRKKGKGDEIIEDKVVATYEPETQTLTFPSANFLRLYKSGVITFLSENEMLVRAFQRGDIAADKPLTKAIPPRPKKTRHEGDKTPAVVEWYHKYRYNEFCTRYGYLGKYTGMTITEQPQWEPRPVDGLPEYRGAPRVEKSVVDAMVATRKTHMTYTPEECVDWDEDNTEASDEPQPVGAGAGQGGDE